ncbi:uncharacterized protein TNCV_3836171 [Trichonephila clavipes]|nr:uncharacterized protein TNCV_3836171 [Trichonephila clavipes]
MGLAIESMTRFPGYLDIKREEENKTSTASHVLILPRINKSRDFYSSLVTNLYGTFPLILLGVFGDCKFAYISNQLWKKKMGYSNKLSGFVDKRQWGLAMSEISRLPDSLRWRVIGWIEMGLSQTDAARHLNVSRSVVHRLWNQYQTETPVSIRHVPAQSRATTPTGDHFIPLLARRRRISVPSICKVTSCVYPSTDEREGPTYLGQENTFPGPNSDALLYSLQTSPNSHWRAIQDVCSSGGNEAPEIINLTLLKDTVIELVE